MSDRVQEIKERWFAIDSNQCSHWWYAAVRHIQRNVDLDLWDCDCGDDVMTPGRYDGPVFAHAKADIDYLLAALDTEEVTDG